MDEAKKQLPTTTKPQPHTPHHRLFIKGSCKDLEQLWDEVSAEEYVQFMHAVIRKHRIAEIVWDGDLINPKYFTHYFPELFASLSNSNEKLHSPPADNAPHKDDTSSLMSSSSTSPARQVKSIRAYRCRGRENLDSLRANLEAHLIPPSTTIDQEGEEGGGGTPSSGISIRVLEYGEESRSPEEKPQGKKLMSQLADSFTNSISTFTTSTTDSACNNHPPLTLTIHESDVEPRFYKELGWYAMSHSTPCCERDMRVSSEDSNNISLSSKVDECANEDDIDASKRNVIVSIRGGMVTRHEFERAREEKFSSMWYCLIDPGKISAINKAYGHCKDIQVHGDDVESVLKRWRYGGHVYRI